MSNLMDSLAESVTLFRIPDPTMTTSDIARLMGVTQPFPPEPGGNPLPPALIVEHGQVIMVRIAPGILGVSRLYQRLYGILEEKRIAFRLEGYTLGLQEPEGS